MFFFHFHFCFSFHNSKSFKPYFGSLVIKLPKAFRFIYHALFNDGCSTTVFNAWSFLRFLLMSTLLRMWSILKKQVDAKNSRDLDELKANIELARNAQGKTYVQKLAKSMHNRCAEILQNRGHITHY